MDLKYIKELMQILDKSGLSKLVIKEKNGVEITLEKGHNLVPAAHEYHPTPLHIPTPQVSQKPIQNVVDIAENCVKSPMVGTFYRADSPESKPFVSVGDTVNVGDPVCIIEAMKVMNEIKSDRSGKIKEILVENGKPVEFGQPLLVIE